MRPLSIALVTYLLVCVPAALPQESSINPRIRTIEVVATETVKAQPDIAEVTLGCVSYGETHDLA